MKSTITTAIENRSVLTFTYRDHPRTVEPHTVGESTAGNDVLRCYQTGGTAEKGDVPDWKLMLLSEIHNLTVTDQHFSGPRPGYKQGDRGMSIIYAQL